MLSSPPPSASVADPSSFAKGTSPQPFISADDARVHFWVVSTWGTSSGDVEIDSIGSAQRPLVIDLLAPAVTAFGPGERPLPSRAMPGDTLQVSVASDAMAQDPQLLVMYHLNPLARRAEVVPITRRP